MAASGYTPIILFNSTTTGNAPTTSNLAVGEVAINVTDGKLFFNQSGTIKVLANATYATSVSTISFGTTGLTPSTATNGVVTVAGTLATTNGGTGLTSFTANGVVYASSTSALATGSGITYNGTTFSTTNDASINGLTVGRGAGAVSSNTAVGNIALASNSTGVQNAAFGTYALNANTGSYNAGLGYAALSGNISGSANIGVGVQSLGSNSTGSNNTAVGYQSLLSTTASNNTAVGYQAGYSNTTGDRIIAIGYQAGYTGTNNFRSVFVGSGAGYATTAADGDVHIGQSAGSSQTTGFANTFVGGRGNVSNNSGAGFQVTTGTYNTFIGGSAGANVTSGSKNTIIGNYSGNNGGLDIRTSSNYIVLSDGDGNPRAYQSSTGGWYQYNNSAAWSITSDARVKTNIKPLKTGLNIINALNPVEFDYIIDGKHDISFLAQEYEKVLPDQVSETSDITDEIKALTNGEPLKQLNQNLVPYLVKAIQELNAKVTALEVKLGE